MNEEELLKHNKEQLEMAALDLILYGMNYFKVTEHDYGIRYDCIPYQDMVFKGETEARADMMSLLSDLRGI